MLYGYLLQHPVSWIVPWVLQSFAYYMLLGKMGLRKKMAVIPFLAEHEFTTVLFTSTRVFWRPFLVAVIFAAGAYYLGPEETTSYAYMIIAMLVYWIFMLRLYRRLAKSFGKGILYTVFMWMCPLAGLLILALGKSVYTPLELRPQKDYGRFGNWLRRTVIALVMLAEIAALAICVGIITIRTLPPKMLVNSILSDTYNDSKDIVSDDAALSRTDTMGAAAADVSKLPVSRAKFFPDHSQDKNVVVMEYIIGSNLENRTGMASANIRMMQEATKRGDALTFVLEAGGSRRWFTDGITEESYGRYEIKDGKLEKVEARDDLKTMESPSELEDFIKWTAEKYPADRYMLVLWDHGGGVAYGYGEDDLAHRDDAEDYHGIRVSEIADAVAKSGVKFDAIGFDACLMQDIEIANSFEPCADYYIGSEETEGGLGWFYTDAFGRLAEDPGLPTEEFGKALISTYDQFNTATNDDKKKTDMTLSFVDLTLLKPAYEQLSDLFVKTDEAVRNDPADFADFGLAAMNAYNFTDNMQIDLIDMIEKLGDTDVNDSICTPQERDAVINSLKASVVYRNKDSAKGINGISIALPYQEIAFYEDTSSELKRLSLDRQRDFFNDVFSIIAVQKNREHEKVLESEDDSSLISMLEKITYNDYSKEEWYVKGFEDYDPVSTLVDIPLKDTGDGYQVVLPEKTWSVVADCVTEVYQKADDGTLRYIGSDHLGGNDEDGHPMVDMGDTWVHMNGRLVCYEDLAPRETDEGTVLSGNIPARLNGSDDILIHVEWDAAKSEDEDITTGHVTGYEYLDETKAFMKKGEQKFETGDKIEFLFDYYDEAGKLVKTEAYGKSLRVTKQDDLKVEDAPLEDCDIEFLGVLTDVYQRNIMTEVMQAHIGD